MAFSRQLAVRPLTVADRESLVRECGAARRRLFLLDYDGTLAPFTPDPGQAGPSVRVLEALTRLHGSLANRVVLLSGRTKDDLSRWFGSLGLTLVAEYGAWVRVAEEDRWRSMVPLDMGWKEQVLPLVLRFVERFPGSSLEEKDTALVWHYRRINESEGAAAAGSLMDSLLGIAGNLDLLVSPGIRSVEVRTNRVSKESFFRTHLAGEPWDFILALGDDRSDEALFGVLPPGSNSVRVGLLPSTARFNIETPDDALALLERMAELGPPSA